MRKSWIILAMAILFASVTWGQEKEQERLEECGDVVKEILDVPDAIPQDLLDRAECVVVFPSVKKAAFGIGGSYGRGAMVCRSGADYAGPWGQATDFVLLIMNDKGAKSVLGSKVKLGADASAAAGPKGRTATAATDVVLKAEILSYSRSRGLFAGVSLEGSTLRSDGDANENLYGREWSAEQIIRKGAVKTPPAGQRLIDVLNKRSPKNLSENK
jgi:lipid-binding SYLF domain-containing protein